ncbi:putative hydroxypyruvate isomerase [Sitodiplosis mosellana]|uniref:putative hydroxypyruvate isomerase n=1 Tax=Sitodiplosis mosellana TaxID=263140 RepID=UPI0024445137|nr:putative hydroxypyruvate isomerase [Sitodiplosis mosellana]
MSLRFGANLNFLFRESGANVLEQFRLARASGFRGIEMVCPEQISKEDVVSAQKENEIEVVLLNVSLGTKPEAAFGCAALPNMENEFRANFQRTLEYAKALNCKKIHIMAGKPADFDAADETYLRNLQFAAEQLESTGIIGVIEPINNYSIPGYYLNCYDKALNILKKLNNTNSIKLMIDLFHLQLIRGNITNTLNELKSHIGHVQVAQAPQRNEPNAAGEVNFKYVFKVLETVGYNGWVGCEYKPTNNSKDNLEWIKEYGYTF